MALHFVGFRGDEYARAVRVFGPPDFVHIGGDRWAQMEVVTGDVAVFARGRFEDEPSAYAFPDPARVTDMPMAAVRRPSRSIRLSPPFIASHPPSPRPPSLSYLALSYLAFSPGKTVLDTREL